MPAHSDLIDAEDLHYAKARLFTGSPTEITPDFAGQILIDEYRRMWVGGSRAIGDLVQVAGNASGGGGGGEVGASIIFGLGAPSEAPPAVGVQYLDWVTRDLYYAWHSNSPAGWIKNKITTLFYLIPYNPSAVPDEEIKLEIYYVDTYLTDLISVPTLLSEPIKRYESSEIAPILGANRDALATNSTAIQQLDLTELINLYGRGAYVFSFSVETGGENYYSLFGGGLSGWTTIQSSNIGFSDTTSTKMVDALQSQAFLNLDTLPDETKTNELTLVPVS